MSHSSSLWMTPRNGDVNCEACTDRPPCMNHDLTFGANFESYSRAINISRIALTEIISFTITPSTTTEYLNKTMATEVLLPEFNNTDTFVTVITATESPPTVITATPTTTVITATPTTTAAKATPTTVIMATTVIKTTETSTIIIATDIVTTATGSMFSEAHTTQITATEVPTDQLLELLAEEESRLQDKVGDWSI